VEDEEKMENWLKFEDNSLDQKAHFLVETLNKFIWQLPEEEAKVGQRLAIQILEAADVASQETIARAAGFSQSRSLRHYKQRLKQSGLAGLFDQTRTGRPSITNQPQLQKMLSNIIWQALVSRRTLPDDAALATQLRAGLADESAYHTQITPSIVKTIRLRLGFERVQIQALFSTSPCLPALVELDPFWPLSDKPPTEPDKAQIPSAIALNKAQIPSATALNKAQIPSATARDKAQIPSSTARDKAQITSATALNNGQTSSATALNNEQPSSATALNNAQTSSATALDNAQISSPIASDNLNSLAICSNNIQSTATASDNVQSTATIASDNAQSTATTASDNVQSTATTAPDNVQSTATTASDNVQSTATTAPDNVQSTSTTASDNAQSTVLTALDNAQIATPVGSDKGPAADLSLREVNLVPKVPTPASFTAPKAVLASCVVSNMIVDTIVAHSKLDHSSACLVPGKPVKFSDTLCSEASHKVEIVDDYRPISSKPLVKS